MLIDESCPAAENAKEKVLDETKQAFQRCVLDLLVKTTKSQDFKKKLLQEMPKTLIPKFENPLFLADFL